MPHTGQAHREAGTGLQRLREQLKEDLATHHGTRLAPGFHAVAVHRIGRWVETSPRLVRPLLRILHKLASIGVRNFYGIEIPPTVDLGRRVKIAHQNGIVLHPLAQIGDDCVIRQNASLGAGAGDSGRFDNQAPRLGRGVSIGAGAVIIGGVTIGDGAQIGPNATVLSNVPAGARVLAPAPRVISLPGAVGRHEEAARGHA